MRNEHTLRNMATILMLCVSMTSIPLLGQVPQYITYQAVISDADGNPVTGPVALKINILRGSEDGTLIYSERHEREADANGMVGLNIGESDNIYYGKFDTINWANGPFFVKVEIAPGGGYAYSITTASELVSVPFALYALRADSVAKDFTETDPVFTSSVAYGITQEDTMRWNSLSEKSEFNIGDLYEGGIIFYLEPGGKHGLIASLHDISANTVWETTNVLTGAASSFDGATNTAAIISGAGDYAAYHCDTLSAGGYDDWYLPSVDELFLLFKARFVIDKTLANDADESTQPLTADRYWTSTEVNVADAWIFEHASGKIDQKDTKGSVRAIRSF